MSGNWQKKVVVGIVLLVVAVNLALIWRVAVRRVKPSPGGAGTSVATTPRSPAEIKSAAEKGDAQAQLKVAEWFRRGQNGFTQDVAQALTWYRQAADQGLAEAQYQAGMLLQQSGGTNQDQALKYFQQAAGRGNTNAAAQAREIEAMREQTRKAAEEAAAEAKKLEQDARIKAVYLRGLGYILGRDGPVDYEQAARCFREAADAGYSEAQLNLGLMYVSGQIGAKNYEEAAKWFRLAGEQGLADAQFNLAVLYVTGRGVAQDYTEAAKWARRAAELGQPDAQYNMAVLLVSGQGVAKDVDEAAKWFRKAADQGHPAAQSNMGVFHIHGRGVPQDYQEAFKWFKRAALQGNATAQFNLGVMYTKGQGVGKDLAESYFWSSLAAAQGDPEAESNRDITALELNPAQIAAALKRQTAFRPTFEVSAAKSSTLKMELPKMQLSPPPAEK